MYTIILRKGLIELELTTDDKYAVEKQLDLIIKQASNKPIVQTPTPTPKPIPQPLPVPQAIEQPEAQPAVFEHITPEEQQTAVVNKEDVIPQSLDIGTVRPMTINSLQNPAPEQEPDFDKILTNEIGNQSDEVPIDKDERYINYVKGKSALEKLDFLVITAQYLAQYEGVNTFNLKHINAKLMQNFTLIVDHSVLQSAISRDFIAQIHQGQDDVSSEYMLTEKGLRSY